MFNNSRNHIKLDETEKEYLKTKDKITRTLKKLAIN